MGKTIKFLLLSGLFILIFTPARAQKNKDAVYLMDGSKLKGTVLEYSPGNYARVEITGGNVLTIPEDEINKIVLNETRAFESKSHNKSGLEFIHSLNVYTGSKNSAGFNTMLNYRFPCNFSAGIGMGFENFNQQVLPVYTEFSYSFLKGKLSPFLYLRAGYGISVSTEDPYSYNGVEYKGGVLAGAGAGIQYHFSDRSGMYFSAGFRYQKLKTETGYYWYEGAPSNTFERIDHLKRLSLSIGFLFN